MVNRLTDALSPYLRQHADNPVDWWEWGDEAFAAARERDVPILLSVGYAACHWCHVMAHESFESPQIAELLNAHFVAIKVDREERPDIDAVYMDATTALTGQGGWPMTCLLTPDGEPFFAGTYLPPEAFTRLLDAGRQAWREERARVSASARHIAGELRRISTRASGPMIDAAMTEAAVDRLWQAFDQTNAGFGGAPKFPPSMVLEFLARHHARTGDDRSLTMLSSTCEAMARGGIYDQLAGGFARYSVDAGWVVPHFEKMLYDNAQLLAVFTHWWRLTKNPLAQRVVAETVQFLLTDLRTAEGGFAASLDADAAGVEGSTYVWTPAQLTQALGADDGRAAAQLLTVTPGGTFEHGASTLQLRADPADPEQWQRWRSQLLRARADRPQPPRDDKVVMAWNGLAIGALAEAGDVFNEPAWIDAARRCADHLLRLHRADDGWRRVSLRAAVSAAPANADDLGGLVQGLVTLALVTSDRSYADDAASLLSAAEALGSPDGGWYDAPESGLVLRPASRTDNAEPCGTSSLAAAYLRLGALNADPSMLARATVALGSMSPVAQQDPRFAGAALDAAEQLLGGPLHVELAGDDGTFAELVRAESLAVPTVPVEADRPARSGVPTAYVCRGTTCAAPVTEPDDLRQLLSPTIGDERTGTPAST